MATPPFHYEPMFQKGPDTTEYYLLTKDYVSVSEFEGKPILKVAKEGLTAMANAAFRDVSFMLRRSHNEQVAKILSDPEATDNDKYVALTFLRNAEVAAKGVLPFCQDTGTAIIHGEKGQQVWTGYCDEEALSLGVYKTYTEENLRYSQNAPLNMYDEVNTKCNLPAQIDIEATEGMEYEFLCVTKGGGSANKTYLYQETKAILNPGTLVPFLVEKIKTLGTAACPPYHIAIVIGGTSAIGIYLLNNIHRNVFVNIGAGVWDTYNMATGLMGDILSYIRLYALGLAGGMLGGVFNQLAFMVNDAAGPALGWLFCGLILIFGHTLNIAMSCLSAFVHPLRLTFVEYFKNSGYEGKGEAYKPFTVVKK